MKVGEGSEQTLVLGLRLGSKCCYRSVGVYKYISLHGPLGLELLRELCLLPFWTIYFNVVHEVTHNKLGEQCVQGDQTSPKH